MDSENRRDYLVQNLKHSYRISITKDGVLLDSMKTNEYQMDLADFCEYVKDMIMDEIQKAEELQ